jgi:hypothetical protein
LRVIDILYLIIYKMSRPAETLSMNQSIAAYFFTKYKVYYDELLKLLNAGDYAGADHFVARHIINFPRTLTGYMDKKAFYVKFKAYNDAINRERVPGGPLITGKNFNGDKIDNDYYDEDAIEYVPENDDDYFEDVDRYLRAAKVGGFRRTKTNRRTRARNSRKRQTRRQRRSRRQTLVRNSRTK